MESNNVETTKNNAIAALTASLISSSSSSSLQEVVVTGACAACHFRKRRCAQDCILAPHFPPNDPNKFAVVHRVYGLNNVIKTLKGLPEGRRAAAVNSMVFEAATRIGDPVYGSAGLVIQLRQQVHELQAGQAQTEAELPQAVEWFPELDDLASPFDDLGNLDWTLQNTEQSPQASLSQPPVHYYPPAIDSPFNMGFGMAYDNSVSVGGFE